MTFFKQPLIVSGNYYFELKSKKIVRNNDEKHTNTL
jgi:hypothetical protein